MTQKILLWQMGSGFGEFAIDQSQIRDVGTPAMLKGLQRQSCGRSALSRDDLICIILLTTFPLSVMLPTSDKWRSA